jgi:hypothetical protein
LAKVIDFYIFGSYYSRENTCRGVYLAEMTVFSSGIRASTVELAAHGMFFKLNSP